MQIHNETSET